jgi:glyoxylase-like metal-dependent hydrolase (beta-lactamase superfamily II)/rhodanese-related sulfurtransferase
MSEHDPGTSSVPTIDVGDLLQAADRGDPLLLLDVRNEDEVKAWKIEARRPVETVYVPYFEFIEDETGSVAKVPGGRDIVVLCAQGGSSEMVAGMLAEAGMPARNVRGGMVAYGEYLDPVTVPLEAEEAGRFAIWQVNRRGKGCLSYVVGSNGEAVVVDPMKNADWFAAFAAARGLRVVHVLDTHIHADHVSGGPALAATLGVPYSVSAGEGFELRQPVTPLQDGQVLAIGGASGVTIEVRVMRTPGHTPGSTSYLIGGRYLMTGDTVFVGGVGRPDLGGHVVEWGRALFTTLTERLAALGDDVLVLPAHYAGVQEIGANGVVSGRLGAIRATVPELQFRTADAFVESVRASVKDPPASYAEIIKVNLGVSSAPVEQITEWELGKNECAASAKRAARGGGEAWS